MPPISVLIKPVSSQCNLQCRYCFYHSVADSREVADFGFMEIGTLESITEKVLCFASENATFSFQGGEPTIRGLDFFEQAVRLQEKYNNNNVHIQNCLQTNGRLIDEQWAQFLHSHHFLVGLSLDGYKGLNDRYRVDAGGGGTYDSIMRASVLFDKYGVDYNILMVVTGQAAQHANKLYNFYKVRNFRYLQFIPCIDPQGSPRGGHPYSLSSGDYAAFLKQFFNRWYMELMSGREVSVRYFDNLVRMVLGMPPETCSMSGICRCQFVFEADGSAYPCDFYVTDEWRIGNIHENDILEMYENGNSSRFMKTSIPGSGTCRKCEWNWLCRGGCRRDRENTVTGKPELNAYCEAYKEFLPYAYPKLVEIARYVSNTDKKVNLCSP